MIICWLVADFSLGAGMLLALLVLGLQLFYRLRPQAGQTPALKTSFVGISPQKLTLPSSSSEIEHQEKVHSRR
jgi:hypothetical protein